MIKLAELLGEKVTFTDKYDNEMKGKQKNLPDQVQKFIKKKKSVKEGDDHEVAMAQASLKSIIKSAAQLMSKLGNMERDIPGWIQDHITNAENYIDQAAQGFHELNEDMDDWGDEKDDYGRSEKDWKWKPSLADFDFDEEEYKKYMEKNFPGEPLDL